LGWTNGAKSVSIGDMRFPCFLVAVGILALAVRFSCAEDLTTLDGNTFTNITEVSKYPKQIFFTCNAKRISVQITNLQPAFCSKHGIQIPVNPVNIADIDLLHDLRTNNLDGFLSFASDSKLTVENSTNELVGNNFRSWTIKVSPDNFELRAIEKLDDGVSHTNIFVDEQSINFNNWSESSAVEIFNKVLQWKQIALQNNVETFEKPIETVPADPEYKYEFYWNRNNMTGGLSGSHTQVFIPFDQTGKISKYPSTWTKNVSTFKFDQKSIVQFLALMQSLPSLKEQLADKIYKEKKQQEMFH
jgi:hypothetical protein